MVASIFLPKEHHEGDGGQAFEQLHGEVPGEEGVDGGRGPPGPQAVPQQHEAHGPHALLLGAVLQGCSVSKVSANP